MLPRDRPNFSREEVLQMMAAKFPEYKWDWDKYPVFVAEIRGYYKKMGGNKFGNDVGIYDDACFIVGESFFEAYNYNIDPAVLKDGMPFIKEGIWEVYKLDLHKKAYLALCQRLGPVEFFRYNSKGAPIPGRKSIGLNLHSGGITNTNSAGCGTVPPWQWVEFIYNLVKLDREGRNDGVIPRVVMNN